MKSLIQTLTERGFIDAVTHPNLDAIIQELGRVKIYCGFDPSAESLHLGNLIGLMGLGWFRKAGHDIVVLIGGATGMIGDPSGKSQERNLLDENALRHNVTKITNQIETIVSRMEGVGSIETVNNKDWYQGISCIDFLRDIGKQFRVGVMLSRESVKARLNSEDGMSFTEFSYQVLQGYDFYHLHSTKNVRFQMGGSDQWGNIISGTDCIRKLSGLEGYGITFPLLVKADGQKFGKSEKGAIWLSKDHMSEFDFFQSLYRTADADVIRLLKMLTFLDLEKIREIEASMQSASYVPNSAQKILAEEVTRFVHGKEGLEKALQATQSVMPGHQMQYTKEAVQLMAESLEPITLHRNDYINATIIDLALHAKMVSSKSEARRLIQNGGLSINGQKVEKGDEKIEGLELIDGQYLVLSLGKKQRSIIKIEI